MAILLAVSLLSGCGSKEGPDEKPIQLEKAGDVISRYTLDSTDYASMPSEPTKILRLHYRRNDDSKNDRACYEAWNVWAWDMANGGPGAAYEFTGYDDYGVYVDLSLDELSEGKGTSLVGFIVRTDNWSKDPDGDRSIEILPATDVDWNDPKNFSNFFEVSEDGYYAIGIHCISDADQNVMMADNFLLEEINADAPQAVENFTVTPGDNVLEISVMS